MTEYRSILPPARPQQPPSRRKRHRRSTLPWPTWAWVAGVTITSAGAVAAAVLCSMWPWGHVNTMVFGLIAVTLVVGALWMVHQKAVLTETLPGFIDPPPALRRVEIVRLPQPRPIARQDWSAARTEAVDARMILEVDKEGVGDRHFDWSEMPTVAHRAGSE